MKVIYVESCLGCPKRIWQTSPVTGWVCPRQLGNHPIPLDYSFRPDCPLMDAPKPPTVNRETLDEIIDAVYTAKRISMPNKVMFTARRIIGEILATKGFQVEGGGE